MTSFDLFVSVLTFRHNLFSLLHKEQRKSIDKGTTVNVLIKNGRDLSQNLFLHANHPLTLTSQGPASCQVRDQ